MSEQSKEVSQEDLDNYAMNNTFLNKAEVMAAVNSVVMASIAHLKTRSAAEQTIIGNVITVFNGELMHELKKLKPFKR